MSWFSSIWDMVYSRTGLEGVLVLALLLIGIKYIMGRGKGRS